MPSLDRIYVICVVVIDSPQIARNLSMTQGYNRTSSTMNQVYLLLSQLSMSPSSILSARSSSYQPSAPPSELLPMRRTHVVAVATRRTPNRMRHPSDTDAGGSMFILYIAVQDDVLTE
jgi:hypothetical protein